MGGLIKLCFCVVSVKNINELLRGDLDEDSRIDKGSYRDMSEEFDRNYTPSHSAVVQETQVSAENDPTIVQSSGAKQTRETKPVDHDHHEPEGMSYN
jgi:hypothetical protein